MKRIICFVAVVALALPVLVQAVPVEDPGFNECILIDFNTLRGGYTDMDAVGADFNAAIGMAVAADDTPSITPVHTDVNSGTPVDGLTFSGDPGPTGSWGANVFDGTAAANLLNDYIYVNPSRASTDITVSGLNLAPDTAYRMWLFGIGDSPNQGSTFAYGGTTKALSSDDPTAPVDVTKWTVDFTVASSASRDAVTFIFNNGTDGGYAAVNGLALKVVPEPSTIALLALGALAFIRRRR